MKLKFFKTSLLFIYMLLIPNLGNAELVGGHDRQRLSLIFFEQLSNFVQVHPISVSRSQFPTSLVDLPENKAKMQLFDILWEEGLLTKTVSAANVAENKILTARIVHYDLHASKNEIDFIVGRVVVQNVKTTIKVNEASEEPTAYDVTFEWRFTEPAPWIWAPILADNPQLIRLKLAMSQNLESTARFHWQDDEWQMVRAPVFFK